MTNELTTYKPSAITAALNSPKVIELNEANVKSRLMDLISKTEFELGYKASDSKQLAMLCNSLYDEIKTEFNTVRIDELVIAFKSGARGEYGDFFGLNVVTFNKWLNGYKTSEKRKEAVKAIRQSEPFEPKMPTKQQALKMFLETWLKMYKEYKLSGLIYINTPFLDYKILFENDLIYHSIAERDVFIDKAKVKFVKDFENKRKTMTNKVLYFESLSILQRIESKDETVDDEPKIYSLACELAIKDYFDKSTTFEGRIIEKIKGL